MASRGDQNQQRQQSQWPQQAPLQAPQEQQQQHSGKPRSYSIHSQRTHRSSGSKHDTHETHEEKEARRLHSKADPTLAMNEAEPSMVAAMKSERTQVSLRAIQHKDPWGNPIDTDSVANWDKRGSVQPGHQPRFPQDSYYSSRPVSIRGDSQYGLHNTGTARATMYENQHSGGGFNNSGYERAHGGSRYMSRDRSQRLPSESHYSVYGREQGVYPIPHKDRSYETVTSAAPSGTSDPAGYQTDPTSSDNSSIDRTSPGKRPEPANDYGIGFSQTQAYEVQNFALNAKNRSPPSLPPPGMQPQAVPRSPAVPRKASLLRRQTSQPDDNSEKRRSWFSRRFIKNG
ncbi:hypothetical protein NOR_06150 [Metarhizium rileyi]|uniref:DUF2406 domain protein n=1 Tax=Metarhizium rileyi (strain RCEF 4871) TaxID=1649241 RepID=A0A167B7A2_METRR|nr:hypothetical protein NOR_06150 [Metarhizium rileyi RCEF 4871]